MSSNNGMTEIQFRTARTLAQTFGHAWGTVPDAAWDWTIGDIIAVARDRDHGWMLPESEVSPHVWEHRAYGSQDLAIACDPTPSAAYGTIQWYIDPHGSVRLTIVQGEQQLAEAEVWYVEGRALHRVRGGALQQRHMQALQRAMQALGTDFTYKQMDHALPDPVGIWVPGEVEPTYGPDGPPPAFTGTQQPTYGPANSPTYFVRMLRTMEDEDGEVYDLPPLFHAIHQGEEALFVNETDAAWVVELSRRTPSCGLAHNARNIGLVYDEDLVAYRPR